MPCKTISIGVPITGILFIKTLVILHPLRNSSFTSILMNRIPVIDTPIEIVLHSIQEFLNNTRHLSDNILNKLLTTVYNFAMPLISVRS
jgi:hypothetical protein